MAKTFFKIIMGFSLIIAVCIVLGCATTDKRPVREGVVKEVVRDDREERLIERIMAEVERGNFARALEIYEEGDGRDSLLRSILLIQNGRLDEAEGILAKIIKEDGSNTTALFYTSLIYNARDEFDREKGVLERIIALDANHIDANLALGRFYARERNHGRAETIFKNVISKNGFVEEAALGYGMALLAQRRTLPMGLTIEQAEARDRASAALSRRALDQFNTIIEYNPNNMFAFVQRANVRIGEDDFMGAEADLSEAIRLDPGYMWNYLDRGRVRLHDNRFAAAVEDFTKALSFDDSLFIAYIHRAQANERMGRDDLALADYRRAFQLRDDYQRGIVPFALQLYRAGYWSEAALHFIRAYNIDHSPEFLLLAAASLKKAGSNDMATRLIRDNLNRIPRENILHHIARMYIDPPYEGIVLNMLRRETDTFMQMKAIFYIGLYYSIAGNNALSEKFFTDILNAGFPGTLEHRIAGWKLQSR
ncbi:MAG: tetratricopeptide repeat protein [Spirochaetes bacterium]|nr:tetratricopeptide repeat protein [Spirochaetota bacterium]